MPPSAPAAPANGAAAITRKLKAHEEKIDALLDERADLKRRADEARERFAGEPDLKADTPAFREAEAAVKRLQAKEAELSEARETQTALLRLLSRGEPDAATKAAGLSDLKAPGAWMAATIRQKA